MARSNDRDRKRKAPAKDLRKGKKKVCIFCTEHIDWVDYKDVNLLRRFLSERGKIRARRVSGNCSQHQADVAVAIKTARELALLPYTQRTVSERGPGRGPGRGGPRGDRGERPERTEEAAVEVADVDLDGEAAPPAEADVEAIGSAEVLDEEGDE